MPAISMMLYAAASAPPVDAAVAWHANANPLVLFAAAAAWASLWAQVAIVPFFAKSERLHQEYHSNGKLNAALVGN